MSYKPKFCCECGEKIERVDSKPFIIRHLCELCETEYGVHDKIPYFVALGGILIGILGLGSYLTTPATKNVQPAQFISRNAQTVSNTQTVSPNLPNANVRNVKAENKTIVQTAPTKELTTRKEQTTSNSEQEVSYFCGAATKKGTPCSRRVKGGGRCWQHEGQPAILPQEKLVAETRAK